MKTSKILFSLSFAFCLWFLAEDVRAAAFIYAIFLWVWLAYITNKMVQHPAANDYDRMLTRLNIIISVCFVFGIKMVMFLLTSFFLRSILIGDGVLWLATYGTPAVFILSVAGHLYVATKNLSIIFPQAHKATTVALLLAYPAGVWIIPDKLKIDNHK